MHPKLLILLTNYYPFYNGEEYLETEIDIASEKFDKILIIPTMASHEMQQTRSVPSNAEILKLDIDCSLQGKMKMVFQQAFHILVQTNWQRIILTETGFSPKKLAYYFYYLCRTEYVYRLISENVCFREITARFPQKMLYSYWMHITASLAARLKERFFHGEISCITRGHRYDLYDYAAPCGFIPDRKYMMEQMNAIYPCSEDGVAYLCQRFPACQAKISVQRLGTVLHEKVTCTRTPKFYLVSCSGVRKVKRLDKIMEVVSALLADGYDVSWTHLGGGPDLESVKKMAMDRLPAGSFSFEGQMANQDIFKWYANHPVSCFINLSDSEGVPVAIMEAMCMGIPVIATDVGGSREIIRDSQNGYLVGKDAPVGRIKELAENILVMDELAYQILCSNSYRIWEELADAKKLYTDFYKQLPI